MKNKLITILGSLIAILFIGILVSAETVGPGATWFYTRGLLKPITTVTQVLIGGTTTSTDAKLEVQGSIGLNGTAITDWSEIQGTSYWFDDGETLTPVTTTRGLIINGSTTLATTTAGQLSATKINITDNTDAVGWLMTLKNSGASGNFYRGINRFDKDIVYLNQNVYGDGVIRVFDRDGVENAYINRVISISPLTYGNYFTGNSTTTGISSLATTTISGDARIDNNLNVIGNISSTAIYLPETNSATNGIIFVNNNRFFHSFRHPTGGTARPLGRNIFIGELTGNTTMGSGAIITSEASQNTIIGYAAFQDNTTGNNNSGIGYRVLQNNTTGDNNIAIGASALFSNITGSNNVAIGGDALVASTSSIDTIAIGRDAMSIGSANNNVAIGRSALQNSLGQYNTALGSYALQALNNISGRYNTALGAFALEKIQATSSDNVAIGYKAGQTIDGGSDKTNGDNNIFIGSLTKAKLATGNNEIVIGYNTTGNGANTVTIGNSSIVNNYFNGGIIATGNATTTGLYVSGSAVAGMLFGGWNSQLGGAVQYWQTEELNLGLAGVYPMFSAYSDGALGNVGAIADSLIVYDKADTGIGTLSFVANDLSRVGQMQYDRDTNKFTFKEANSNNVDVEISNDLTVIGDIVGANLSGTNTGDQNLSGLVPYTGATANVALGSNSLTTTGTVVIGTSTITSGLYLYNKTMRGEGSGVTVCQQQVFYNQGIKYWGVDYLKTAINFYSDSIGNNALVLTNNGDLKVTRNLTVNTNTLFANAVTNRVGIGTTTPAYTLDVYGNTRIDGNTTSTNLYVTGNTKMNSVAGTPYLITASTTLSNTYTDIYASSSDTIVLTLPTASTIDGHKFEIKNIGSALVQVVSGIDGVTTTTLSKYDIIKVQSAFNYWWEK